MVMAPTRYICRYPIGFSETCSLIKIYISFSNMCIIPKERPHYHSVSILLALQFLKISTLEHKISIFQAELRQTYDVVYCHRCFLMELFMLFQLILKLLRAVSIGTDVNGALASTVLMHYLPST